MYIAYHIQAKVLKVISRMDGIGSLNTCLRRVRTPLSDAKNTNNSNADNVNLEECINIDNININNINNLEEYE